MQDKISVIIPVYNVAKYLPKCIDSVLNQTYKNLEIILVDDGSTDESGKISDEYSYKDNRVKVIHKKNGGPGDARNTGIKEATGKYIGFIDSDDFIETDMYEILLKTLYDYDADIVQCALYRITENNIILPKYYSGTVEQFDVTSALEEFIRKRKFNNNIFNKIYKKDLIQGNEYPVDVYSGDVVFNYKIFARAQKLVSIEIPKYYYVKRKESIVGSLAYLEKMDGFYVYLGRLEFIYKNFPSLSNLALERFYKYLIKIYIKIKENEYIDKDKKKRNLIKNYITTNYRSLMSNPLINRKHKMLLKILNINFELGYYLRYFYIKLRSVIQKSN